MIERPLIEPNSPAVVQIKCRVCNEIIEGYSGQPRGVEYYTDIRIISEACSYEMDQHLKNEHNINQLQDEMDSLRQEVE